MKMLFEYIYNYDLLFSFYFHLAYASYADTTHTVLFLVQVAIPTSLAWRCGISLSSATWDKPVGVQVATEK